MTDEQLQRLLEIEEEVLVESNLKYFSTVEMSREFSNGPFGHITKKNLINIIERFESEKPKLRLYKVDFAPVYPVPCVLIVLAHDENEAFRIASETVIHTGIIGIDEIQMDGPKVVVYESGNY